MKSTLVSLSKLVGLDYLIHHESLLQKSDFAADALWSVSTGTFKIWAFGSSSSEWYFRQATAAAYHFGRIVTACGVSSVDIFLSRLMKQMDPTTVYFNDLSSKTRFYKRLMLAARLNGGVYNEMADMGRNVINSLRFLDKVTPYYNLNATYPVYSKVKYSGSLFDVLNLNDPISPWTLQQIFYSETGQRFEDVFSYIKPRPILVDEMQIFEAEMKNGQKVSISVIPPHLYRMRKLDMVPLTFLSKLLHVIPGTKPECSVVDFLINRFNFNLQKESNARIDLLRQYGVSPKLPIPLLFSKSRSIKFPLRIAAPVPSLSGPCIMVSDLLQFQKVEIDSKKASTVINAFCDALFKNQRIIADISNNNIVSCGNSLSLVKFASLATITHESMHNLSNLAFSLSIKDESGSLKYGNALNIAQSHIAKSLNGEYSGLARSLMESHAPQIISLSESMVHIMNMAHETKDQSLLFPLAAGSTAKFFSKSSNHTKFPFFLYKFLPKSNNC